MRPRPQLRQAIVGWGAAFGVLVLFAGVSLGQSAIPGHPDGAMDDLAAQSWGWEEVRRDGLVVDFLGVPYTSTQPVEVAYRVHGDIAAIEGSLLPDPSRSGAAPIFNTGARLFEIVFDPPLALADGGLLERVRPASLNWTSGDTISLSGRTSTSYAAEVPHPGNGTTSPPGGATGGPSVLVLDWYVSFLEKQGPTDHNLQGGLRSPAMAQSSYFVNLSVDELSDEGRDRLGDTTVRFAFLFDFGGSGSGRIDSTAGDPTLTGFYLYRGDAAALMGFVEDGHRSFELDANSTAGRHIPTNETSVVQPPIALNVTVLFDTTMDGNGTLSRVILRSDFGYLMDLPEPPSTPSPDPSPPARDTPLPLFLGLLAILVAALVVRRTEAHR